MRDQRTAATTGRGGLLAGAVAVLFAAVCAVLSIVVVGWTVWTAVVITDLAVAALGVVVITRRRRWPRRRSTVLAAVLIVAALLAIGTTIATWFEIAAHDDHSRPAAVLSG